MQIKFLHKNVYRLANYSLNQSKIDACRMDVEQPIKNWNTLKKQGVDDKTIADIIGISRAKYYRLKKKLDDLNRGILPPTKRPKNLRKSKIPQKTKDLILKIRRENQTYGKAKISVILQRDHKIILSESSIGRELKLLISKGIVTKSRSATRAKRKRKWNKYAQPWSYNMRPKSPGEMIQIDHMSVSKNGISFKHFQAWDPVTKIMVTEIYSNAKAKSAQKFLLKAIKEFPFDISSIQVDGGSEFMKEFEAECELQNIPLLVLPPSRPQYNGGVERGNRIFREELYQSPDLLADSIGCMRFELKKATHKYNDFRPHYSLDGKTPFEYKDIVMKIAA